MEVEEEEEEEAEEEEEVALHGQMGSSEECGSVSPSSTTEILDAVIQFKCLVLTRFYPAIK